MTCSILVNSDAHLGLAPSAAACSTAIAVPDATGVDRRLRHGEGLPHVLAPGHRWAPLSELGEVEARPPRPDEIAKVGQFCHVGVMEEFHVALCRADGRSVRAVPPGVGLRRAAGRHHPVGTEDLQPYVVAVAGLQARLRAWRAHRCRTGW